MSANPHRHRHTVLEKDSAGVAQRRICSVCGEVQIKHKGKWAREEIKSRKLPNGQHVTVQFIGERKGTK